MQVLLVFRIARVYNVFIRNRVFVVFTLLFSKSLKTLSSPWWVGRGSVKTFSWNLCLCIIFSCDINNRYIAGVI